MLADERGELRWATASDQQTQLIEEGQERLGQGAMCERVRRARPDGDARHCQEPHWGTITDVVTGPENGRSSASRRSWKAARSAAWTCARPNPRDWDQAEISAAQAYAPFAAMLLSQAVATQVKGRLAEHSSWRWSTAAASSGPRDADGAGGLDDAVAFGRLRSTARSSRWPLTMPSTRCSVASGCPDATVITTGSPIAGSAGYPAGQPQRHGWPHCVPGDRLGSPGTAATTCHTSGVLDSSAVHRACPI
jgi:hypothetical protein